MTRPVVVELRADGKGVISTFRTTEREAAKLQRRFDGTSRSTQQLDRRTQSATQSFKGFRVAAAAAMVTLAARNVARRADEMTRLNARMRLVTDTTQEYRRAQQAVNQIAQESGREIGAVGELYVRLQQSLKDVNAEAGEIETITRAVTQSMRVSGASAAESAGAIRQLSQSFAAGVLRGDEFNSVNEQAPRLMQALADSMGVTRGELRNLAEQGKLTSDILREALVDQAGEIAAESAQIPSTLGEAWTRMQNSLTGLVGQFDEAAGSSQGFAGAMDSVADSIDRTADWIGDNMLNIRLAGIAMVRGMLLAFEELKGGLTLYRAVATEAIQFIANTWNSALATMNEGLAEFVRRAGNALGALPGFDDLGQRIGFMADALEANAAAARENVIQGRSLGEVWAETRASVNEAKNGIRNITDAMADDAIAARNAADATDEFSEATNTAGDAAGDAAGINESLAKSYEDMVEQLAGQIESLREEQLELRGGTRAVLDYRIAKLEASGATDEMIDTVVELRDQLLEEEDALAAVREELEANEQAARESVRWMVEMARAAVQAATGMDMLGEGSASATGGMERPGSSDLARGLASAISASDGQDLGDSIGNALRAYGTDGITAGLQDSLADAFEQIGFDAESGSGAISVAAVALGQAVGDQTGAAVGTVLGAAIGSIIPGIGTMIGAALGGAIGGLFDGEKDPYFVFGGSGSSDPTYLEDFETHMGDVQARMRHMDESAQDELRAAFRDFDETLASLIDSTMLEEAQATLEAWEYIGHQEGNSVESMLQSRFDAVLSIFDEFTQSIVRKGLDLEEDMERLASVFAIEREMLFGGGLGLTGAGFEMPDPSGPGPIGDGGIVTPPPLDPVKGALQPNTAALGEFNAALEGTGDAADVSNAALAHTLQIVDDLNRPTETLADTFVRLRTITDALDTGLALTGQQFDGSREDLIRFGDQLSQVFGDDLDRLTEGLNRVYQTFFTDGERLGVQAQQATAQATGLLEQAGIDVTADMLTLEGFREVWDEFFGQVGPEQQALLIEAGVAVADLIEAEEALTNTRSEATRELGRQMDQVMSDLRGMQWSPLRQELFDINQATRETVAALDAAGAAEEDYLLVLQRHDLQIQALAGTLRASLTDMRDQLFGGGNDIGSSMQTTASQIGGAMQDIQTSMIDAIAGVQEWLDSSLLGSNSPLAPQEQLDTASDQFWDAISAAQSGDADAASQLPQLADQFLDLAGGFHGTSTAEFQAIWDQVRSAMEDVAGMDVAEETRSPTYGQQQSVVDATQGTEMTALEQARLAGRMLDEIGVLAGISEDSTAAEIANELDIPIGSLIEAVTGELPDLTGDALADYFNDLVDETDQQLSTLGRIEGVLEDIRAGLEGVVTVGELVDMGFGRDVPPEDPPGFATGGWSSGIVNTGERGPELILDNHVSEFFRRNGVPVTSGGSDPETRRLLRQIEQRLARMEELADGGNELAIQQIRAIHDGSERAAQPMQELVTRDRTRSQRRPTARVGE